MEGQRGEELSLHLGVSERDYILRTVEEKVEAIFAQMTFQPVHDITHTKRVVDNIKRICAGEIVDNFLAVLCGWLHDIGRLQEQQALKEGRKVFHAEESAKLIPEILSSFNAEVGCLYVEKIADAVARHSQLNKPDDSLLTIILKDADRLDGLGAIGFPRVFAFYPQLPIYNPVNPFTTSTTSEAYLKSSGKAYQLEAFQRNLEWFSLLRTKTAIMIGIPRVILMINFLYQLADELGYSRSDVNQIEAVKEARKMLNENRKLMGSYLQSRPNWIY